MRGKFIVFDFTKKTLNEIYLTNEFFQEYQEYRDKNCLPYGVEDLVAFYHMKQGFSVDRLYLQRKAGLDLIVTKGEVVMDIEVKTRFDLLRLSQLEHIFLNDNCFIYWVLPDETDISDLRY
jgi:hypothetical protein